MIRDRLVVGIRDTSLSERLQMDPDLTLENAKKTVWQKKAAGLMLNKEKCIFSSTRLKFLGHIIDKDGTSADPDKTAAIRDLQQPYGICSLQKMCQD